MTILKLSKHLKNKESEHPLIQALKLKKKAIKLKADKRIIENLEKIISERSKEGAEKINRLSSILGIDMFELKEIQD